MRKLASIRKIASISPIDGADKIELALVDGWRCVIKKGEFEVGDVVIYCEIDSFLPIRPEFEFLRASSFKTMGEREGFRLRTVKLRGQISQGLLLSASVLNREVELGEDVSQELEIVKYEAPIPACLGGNVVGPFPTSIAKTDEERVQNLASDFGTFQDKQFHVTEKLDGTSFTAFFDTEFGVCGRNWQLAFDEKNSYWQMANKLNLSQKLKDLGRRIAVQGELVGPGIQKNRYKLDSQELFVFNVFDIEQYAYVAKDESADICQQLGLQQVPFVEQRSVPTNMEDILALAEGKSKLNSSAEREGLVWVHGAGASRISFKTISNKFLAKHG